MNTIIKLKYNFKYKINKCNIYICIKTNVNIMSYKLCLHEK